ncbi:hypothetical protein [Winogradskyella sp.]|uniref:hypothetical protein n=1 Tax=Winogradskyella sp. TaxID=1883156 RepID=UPI003BACA27E
MTSGQRKAHKFIWLVLAVAIPIFMFITIKNLDFNRSDDNDITAVKTLNEKFIKTAENDLIKVNVYKKYIEVILKSPLKHASSVVYATSNQGKKGQALGQLTTVGIYKFNITDVPTGLLVYNPLKELEITKLTF